MFEWDESPGRDLAIEREVAVRLFPLLVAELLIGIPLGGIVGITTLLIPLELGPHVSGQEFVIMFLALPAIGLGALVGVGAAATTAGVFYLAETWFATRLRRRAAPVVTAAALAAAVATAEVLAVAHGLLGLNPLATPWPAWVLGPMLAAVALGTRELAASRPRRSDPLAQPPRRHLSRL